jgi:hypothetical protein
MLETEVYLRADSAEVPSLLTFLAAWAYRVSTMSGLGGEGAGTGAAARGSRRHGHE